MLEDDGAAAIDQDAVFGVPAECAGEGTTRPPGGDGFCELP